VLPVILVRVSIGDTFYGFPYLVLAVVVLFFSLGPKDIGEQIDEYCKAVEADDDDRIADSASALTEAQVESEIAARTRQVEEAVCVQANNRLFAVVFWFVLLGPVGAWSYRVVDLIRRRAVQAVAIESEGGTAASEDILHSASNLHAWLAWIPARLTAIGYGLAGSFDGATSAWRAPAETRALSQREQSEQLLARVGTGALAVEKRADETDAERAIRGAIAANGLVFRQLIIWAAAIAAMTLYGWSV